METQLAKKAAAGSVATINLRGDSRKGAEEIKKDDICLLYTSPSPRDRG